MRTQPERLPVSLFAESLDAAERMDVAHHARSCIAVKRFASVRTCEPSALPAVGLGVVHVIGAVAFCDGIGASRQMARMQAEKMFTHV
jgi:hypothetical protein